MFDSNFDLIQEENEKRAQRQRDKDEKKARKQEEKRRKKIEKQQQKIVASRRTVHIQPTDKSKARIIMLDDTEEYVNLVVCRN